MTSKWQSRIITGYVWVTGINLIWMLISVYVTYKEIKMPDIFWAICAILAVVHLVLGYSLYFSFVKNTVGKYDEDLAKAIRIIRGRKNDKAGNHR